MFVDAFGEDVTFTPPPAGAEHFVGLLTALSLPATTKGRPAGQETLTGGDGHRYVIDPSTKAGFKTLYGVFAKSWRVTQKTSLFTYRKGESTVSYEVKGFPSKEATIAGLSPLKKARAQRVCNAARITNTKLLNDCILDVGTTGITDLATTTARVQNAVESPIEPVTRTGSAPTTSVGSVPVTPVGSTHPAAYYFTHPCEALTAADIKAALGQAFPTNPGVETLCIIQTHPTDVIAFSHDSVAKFKSEVPTAPGSGPIAGLGGGADTAS